VSHAAKDIELLIDPATGKILGTSLWESETDRAAVQSSGVLQEQFRKFAVVLAALPVPSTYEVKVDA
jgi:hypothetical protein